jgi:hypothetical protein
VRRHAHAGGLVFEHGIDVADVALVQVLGVRALRGHHRPLPRTVEVGEAELFAY